MKLAKEEWLKSQCRQIDNDIKRGVHSKRAYTTIKSITHTKCKTTLIYNDGTPLADDSSRQCRWTEYCKGIYNHPIEPDLVIFNDSLKVNHDEGLSILNSEVELAIKSLNSGKTPGIYNIPCELIKSGWSIMTKIFNKLCQQIF